MKRKGTIKKGIAWLMTAVMMFSITPVMAEQAQAEESQAQETSTTTKTIAGLGTSVIADPTAPANNTDAWKGSYVYYGNYDANGDGTSEPVKYRVLDASTTKFGGTTMFLDCDSILYYQKFDNDTAANEDGKKANDWLISDIKKNLNGDGFLNKAGVFTTAEKNAIAASNVASHALTTDSATGVNVASGTQSKFGNYVALTGEQIFLLDAEDVSNGAYGYSMTNSGCENRKKTGSSKAYWWLRSALNDIDFNAGHVYDDGLIGGDFVSSWYPGVSPALNLNLSSVLFSSVISGTAGETGAEYKLTLLDGDMTIAASGDVTRNGKTVTVPYSISGGSSANATQVSVLVLDKEYTAGNTNGATVLDYQKLNVDSFSTSGTGTYTLPDSLYRKGCGTDYHIYILAEDVNGEKETDYASTPVKITPTWKAPTVKQMNFGTKGIIDPAVPNSASDAWKGSYVYYGNYDADDNGTAEPVKYRVLDASTTDFSADGTTQTMFLDCDSILYYTPFDSDGTANEVGKKANDWSISDVKSSLNGEGFLNKEGVFTTAEKNAIAASNVEAHALTTDSEMGVNVASWTQEAFVNYVALTGEQIFLLDAEDGSNGAYGYSMTDVRCENRKKTGSSAAYWWLRSASSNGSDAGCVSVDGLFSLSVNDSNPGVSPALNLNLSSVIFSSANTSETSFAGKSSALTSDSTEIGTEANTDWKLTLKDTEKSVKLTEGRSVTKASDGTITVPYTYKDKENATEKEKVNQISVMITDKAYDAEKAVNAQEAQILYYGALQDIKNAEGNDSTVAEASTGTGTFALPSGLTGTLGTDYHIYLLAEHVNADNSTDYASEPKEVTAILDEVDTVTVPSIDTPIAEEPLKEEITVSSEGVAEKATLTWKKNDTVATGNAQWKTTYQAYVTLTATDGYSFMDATGNRPSVTLNGQPVDTENITLNADGTLTVYCGEYTTATRKTESADAPEVPTQFANYYTADNVLSSTELGTSAKVTLEGKSQPNPEEMDVEWSLANEGGAAYDATPTATNTFKWTIKKSEYADYNKDTAVLEGTVTIQNKDYTPVTITGENVTVTYHGEDTLNVSQYFTIDENAGTPTYKLLDTSTGAGTLDGTTLTMTTLGTFVVKVSTPINDVYNKGEHTLTITVNKAAPNVTALPTVADRIYHPSTVLADTDITDGTVKDVSGNSLAGTWRWKEAGVVPTVGNGGYVAVFTPNDTAHYQSVEKTIFVNVSKATPYIKTAPTTTAITYGEALSASTLKDAVVWYSKSDEKAVKGTFTWKEAATKPTVADSNKTEYDVVFTPTDAEKYNTVETKITLTVNKAASAPNKPNSTMEVDYGKEKVSDITTLPEGWAWQDEDKDKALTVGTAVKATAVYTGADKGNYVTESVEVSITRQACTHTWDGGVVTKEATATQKGEKTYTCTVCKETKKEEIPVKTDHSAPTLGDAQDDKASKQALPVGTKKTSDDRKATYKVTTSDLTKGTVTYVAPTDAKATTVTIPATVVIDGVTYKVTAIEKNAFKNNKYIKKVIIGNNIITIGDNAFYGCKKLKTVTIGKSVTKIGSKAFYGCSKIKTLTIKSTKLTTKKIGSKAFTKTPKKMTVKVPKSKLKSYKKLLKAKGVNSRAKIKK